MAELCLSCTVQFAKFGSHMRDIELSQRFSPAGRPAFFRPICARVGESRTNQPVFETLSGRILPRSHLPGPVCRPAPFAF